MIEDLIARMAALLESLQAAGDPRRYFHATYQRTTIAVSCRCSAMGAPQSARGICGRFARAMRRAAERRCSPFDRRP